MKQPHHSTPVAAETTFTQVWGWAQELERLHARIAPRFARPEPRRRALAYLRGILSATERKNGWQLAEHAGEARPDGMQRLLSNAMWDADGVRDDLRNYVLEQLGDPQAILVIDETSFPKRGCKSAGVQPQYCGTTGQIENCQVGVFLAYASPKGHALIDRELYLPLSWLEDRERCREAGIADSVHFQTKCELAQKMIERIWQAHIPISWVVADTVYGSNLDLRGFLEACGYAYVLAVACDEPVGIQTPDGRRWVEAAEVEQLVVHAQDWQRLSMSEGTKGPRLFDWVCVPILHHWEDDGRHWLLIRRSPSDPSQKTYYFVFAPKGTTLQEMVEAIGARWHIEEDFETGKDMGLDHYEVRSWIGWYVCYLEFGKFSNNLHYVDYERLPIEEFSENGGSIPHNRHVTLVMLAHAFAAVICAQEKARTTLEATLDATKPARPLLALTVSEVRHLLGQLVWPHPRAIKLVLAWSWWRRCHRSCASYYHTKRRLEAG